MCGRYSLTYRDLGRIARELAASIDAATEELHRARFNIAPTDAVVIAAMRAGVPTLVPALWGFHLDKRLVINVRSETAATRFRAAYAQGRCVVPADGLYEWPGAKNERRPVWFHRPDGQPLYFAGLLRQEGEGAPPSFVILTGPPVALVAAIHDRMPVVLTAEHARAWLAAPEAALSADGKPRYARRSNIPAKPPPGPPSMSPA